MSSQLSQYYTRLMCKGSFSLPELRSRLNAIGKVSEAAAKRKRFLTIATVSCILGFFLPLFITPVLPQATVLLPLIVLAGIVLYILGRYNNRLETFKLRYQLPIELAQMLSRDMAPQAPITAHIDFSKPMLRRKRVLVRPWPKRSKWTESLFVDPWLTLSGQFLDGTTFTLSLTDVTVQRKGSKRSRSGKIKLKKKTKPKGVEVKLLLTYLRKKYGAMCLLNDQLPQALDLPANVTVKKVQASDRQFLLRVKVPAYSRYLTSPEASQGLYSLTTRMLLSAYQALNLAKQLSKISK